MSAAAPGAFEYPDSLFAGLRRAAEDSADTTFLRVGGESFSYAQAFEAVLAVAAGIQALGIGPGERVGIMAPNHAETVWAWLGANAARTIDVPFNAEARGEFLAYLVEDAAPRLLIATRELLETLAGCGAKPPEFAVCIGPSAGTPFGAACRHLDFDQLMSLSQEREIAEPGPGEIATIMYTSGTTGASKGVMLPQRSYAAHGALGVQLTGLARGETAYCVQPLFHIDSRAYLAATLSARATLALGVRFSASNFWSDVRKHGANVLGAIGTMIWLLYKQPPSPDDRDHPARLIASSSTPPEIQRKFEQRFGIEVTEAYGMTESVYLTSTHRGHTDVGSIGWPVPLVEIRVVDDEDRPVAPGQIGELIYRHHDAFTMMQGYWGKPEDTVSAWRNLWFHSGDFVRPRDDGQFEYIGRKKDAIRRRGENISAWEVEQAITKHPDVLEAAALGVPSEVGEEDVAVLVVLRPGTSADLATLREFVAADLPKFAVPRYVELVDALPKTPSERIAKGEVRARGITAAAWDAERAEAAG